MTSAADEQVSHSATPPATGPAGEAPDADAVRLDAAARIISRYCAWSAVAGAVPVPVVDVAALAVLQTKMVADLGALYDKPISVESVRTVVSVLLGILVPMSASEFVTRLVGGAIPGAGLVVGIASMAAFSGAATYAIGRVFVSHFEGGGTLHDFSVDTIRKDLQREFARAKKGKAAEAT